MVHGGWRMDIPIKFEDVTDEENDQEFNTNHSEDEN